MKTLFDERINIEIVNRVEKITSKTVPLWGKMTAGQMLAHCSVGLESALGDKKQKRTIAGLLFGKFAKKSALGEKPFSKGLPTDKTFIMTEDKNTDFEKANLVILINRFTKAGTEGMSKHPHPFFGKMTPEEWGILQYKHLDHHLRQFGV